MLFGDLLYTDEVDEVDEVVIWMFQDSCPWNDRLWKSLRGMV